MRLCSPWSPCSAWCRPKEEKKQQKALLDRMERDAKDAEKRRRRAAKELRQNAHVDMRCDEESVTDMEEDTPLTEEEMEADAEAPASGTHPQRSVALQRKVFRVGPEATLSQHAGMRDEDLRDAAAIPGGAEGASFMSPDEMQADAEALANSLSQVGSMVVKLRYNLPCIGFVTKGFAVHTF